MGQNILLLFAMRKMEVWCTNSCKGKYGHWKLSGCFFFFINPGKKSLLSCQNLDYVHQWLQVNLELKLKLSCTKAIWYQMVPNHLYTSTMDWQYGFWNQLHPNRTAQGKAFQCQVQNLEATEEWKMPHCILLCPGLLWELQGLQATQQT